MISITLTRNRAGHLCGFIAENHGDSEVCAAISLLALNTANSIEALTDEPFSCDYQEEGGYLRFELPRFIESAEYNDSSGAGLLLESLALGLRAVKEKYGRSLEIKEVIL